MAVSASVWATSLGTNLTVSGTSTLTGDVTASGALTVTGASTLTGDVTASGALAVTGASTLTGAATLSSTLAVTGLSTLTGGLLANNATSTIRNLDMISSTSTSATSTTLYASGNFRVGSNGTRVTSIFHGFCDFGPIVAGQTIAATTTGTVACTTQTPTGHAAGDKVWLTASTTAPTGVNSVGNTIIYTGIASSTAAGRIQAMIYNGTGGAAFTVTTSSWQYFIIK